MALIDLGCQVLVTRIDISLVPDTGGDGRILALSFSDGSAQNLTLSAASSQDSTTWYPKLFPKPTQFLIASVFVPGKEFICGCIVYRRIVKVGY